jgi:hypothetical protein
MRRMLRMVLTDAGYSVTEAVTYAAVLRALGTAAQPVVVVAGTWEASHQAEVEFFGQVAADAALVRRHRFVLLTTVPEFLPDALEATLRSLGVVTLEMPARASELLEAVALAAGRPQRAQRAVTSAG